jgi:hypothetical protein
MNNTKSETDWERVLAFKEGDPIPYEMEDGPYNSNDAEAARALLAQADLIRKGKIVRRGRHRQEMELRRSRLESELLDALQTKDLVITPEELKGRSLVPVLRGKLGHN